MPLRADLLEPIPGENPSGENLRYAPVYDQIKEARREELDIDQGVWAREIKRADYALVVKLASEALAKKSKDLQLAAWLTEAMLRREGIAGLREGIGLIQGLLENFWDTLYPELEDGDPELRSGILEWVGSKLDEAVRRCSLTRDGLDWFAYKESRSIPYEEECESSDAKRETRETALAEGKLAPEAFDKAVESTPKQFYTDLLDNVDGTLDAVRNLESWCDERFGDVAPSFSGLRQTLEEFRQTVRILLERKRSAEAPLQEPAVEEAAEEAEQPAEEVVEAAPRPVARAPKKALTAEPADRDDAVERVIAAARYLRREEPYSPAPYLMLRGLRWGELRAAGSSIDPALLEAPPSEIRQQLKKMSMEGSWAEVLETAETAMGLPCGRGWLDLQRYVVRACAELGGWYDPIANSIRSELRALLADYPDLPQMTLMDDTPTANRETLDWLAEFARPAEPQAETAPELPYTPPPPEEPVSEEYDAPPDAYALATEALREGRREEAIGILTREIAQERSGRGRFLRRTQLAQICLAAGKELIAFPILRDLAAEIESRRLEEWEAPDTLAHTLVLLYRCLTKLNAGAEEKQRVYERICRLDPIQAMSCSS